VTASTDVPVVGLVGCAVGGVEHLRDRLVRPLLQRGRRVAVTLTPTAATWLQAIGEIERIEQATELPVRWQQRLPGGNSPHPPVDCYVVAPASANMVARLALGLMDNQASTQICEAIGGREIPVIVFPRINAAHAGQPAWEAHLGALRSAGVRLVYGEDVWPLYRPRAASADRELPWNAVLDVTESALLRR
jgi:phosphopantothenoylcysteine synthetase/decarboxylase